MSWENLLAHPAVQMLGSALLHFLWQGSLLALLLWMVRAMAPTSARVRYAAASFVMLLMPVALVMTTVRELRHETAVVSVAPNAVAPLRVTGATSHPVLLAGLPESAPSAGVSGWVVCLWIAGVVVLSMRAAGGWMRAERLKRGVLPVGDDWEATMIRLQRRVCVSSPVRLFVSAVVQVPTVIGWMRPYILLPVTAITGLSESQLQAILAHELAHIRRHDYLVNLLQTAIETVLFYHPAVWWVGKQMRIEREHCCDDIAVAVCGNAMEYASALAELEEIRCAVPEPALAATGGELLGRIRRLLGKPASEDRASRSLGTIAAAVALVLFIAGIPVVAQQPAFEVASIKLNVSGDAGPRYMMGPSFKVESATLKDLVKMAYDLEDFRLSGGPGWIDSERYNIEAKAAGNPGQDRKEMEAWLVLQRQRLQTLLQDRFKLVVHRETKELPIYELTVAKGGPKLQPTNCVSRDPRNPAPLEKGQKQSDICGYSGFGRGFYENTTATVADVAHSLPFVLGRLVVDKTGITGTYHVFLKYVQDEATPGAPTRSADPAEGANIFTAIQEQLGLKIESAKGPVDVLVIDRVEKPSEN